MSLALVVSSLSVGVTVSATSLALEHVSAFSSSNSSLRTRADLDVFEREFTHKVCTVGSECQCVHGTTVWGASLICIECARCGKICMADHAPCRQCLASCDNCGCIEQCGQLVCRVPNHPVTKIALGCGILFLATAALAFIFKIILMCCLSSVGRHRGRRHEDDTASVTTVDRLVAHRLRDAPPRYEETIGSNTTSISQLRQPATPIPATPIPDKPPPYNPLLNRGELSLQVSTLPDAPPPYSFSYQNQTFTSEEQSGARPPTAGVPTSTTPTSPITAPTPALEPGRELCRTLTM